MQYVAVPSGGIGGDMTFYYTEPKAGNIWVFALDGGGPARAAPGSNLVTLENSLPRVGQPGATLGGRVLPGYGFPETEGGEPIPGPGPPQPTGASQSTAGRNPLAGDAQAIAAGEATYRARCLGCHRSNGGSGPNLFGTALEPGAFFETVEKGREGTVMPAFGSLLSDEQIWEIQALTASRDRL